MNKVPSATTQSDRVFAGLRTDILSCVLAPASKISIPAVCERYGVSLGAAREALSRLIPEGLVDNEPQKGFAVAPVSRRELLDLTEARIDIEATCLRQSLAQGDVEWETRVVASHHRLSRIAPSTQEHPGTLSPSWSAAHATFHAALASACANKVLLRLRATLYDESERYRHWCLPLTRDGAGREVAWEHETIMRAALARDTETCCGLMRDHLQHTTDILLRSPVIMAPDDEEHPQ